MDESRGLRPAGAERVNGIHAGSPKCRRDQDIPATRAAVTPSGWQECPGTCTCPVPKRSSGTPGGSVTEIFAARLGENPWGAIVSGAAERHGSWAVGGIGELHVAQQLQRLAGAWFICHDVQLPGRGNLDHLLLGPAGPVVVNAKYTGAKPVVVDSGRMQVGGRDRGYLGQAEREADVVTKALGHLLPEGVGTFACIAVVGWGPQHLQDRTRPDVRVLRPEQLVAALARAPRRLSDCRVRELTRASRTPQTWAARQRPRSPRKAADAL